jgi:ATP-dependent DNA ligase
MPFVIQSLEAATVDAIVIYRASLHAVEDMEAKMEEALEDLKLRAFDALESRYVDLLEELRENRQTLEALLDDLGYIPKVPSSPSFN